MKSPTDVEISRALNALSTTLRDQRPSSFDAARVQEIVTGALAGEPKLLARATGTSSGDVRIRGDDRLVAKVGLHEGSWTVERKILAEDSTWAIPQPAHDEHSEAEAQERAS